jgi:asparagine synthase (glutamine-hydrolysing)
MCGIAGIFNLEQHEPVVQHNLSQMLGTIRHRGPDQFGMYLGDSVGLGNARLSIIDLSTGQQPISNEDGNLWIVFNGEIFNYLELRAQLQSLGHRFRTNSDTEVLLHSFEEFGSGCLGRLNGQFAFAIWNARDQSLFLARDRLGVRPLFYAVQEGRLIFASEIKALLASGLVRCRIDPTSLAEVFTVWSPLSPRTVFDGVVEVPPGHYAVARAGLLRCHRYWDVSFPQGHPRPGLEAPARSTPELEAGLRDLLVDAVKIRLRADVPVGVYLSGGLDSSMIAAIAGQSAAKGLDTFSIAFEDGAFDESRWQMQMANLLGTRHQVIRATCADIGHLFPQIIWHTEVPILRTAPAPMYMLSRLARDSGYKVVLTGEGADEFLGGYDIFKEAKIRRFWASQPQSISRPLLLNRIYGDIGALAGSSPLLRRAFFQQDLMAVDSPSYSHALRWRNGRRNCRFLSDDVRHSVRAHPASPILEALPAAFQGWDPLAKAQYLEVKTFLSPYLLSSQGDRMGMAHSVEGRFPFLDTRVVEFCNHLPATLKLHALTEKYLLKRLGKKCLPQEIWQRPKRPYRAPIHRSFFNQSTPDYVRELLSPRMVQRSGLFSAMAVSHLVQKIDQGSPISETEDMALAGILSSQLIYHRFIENFRPPAPLSERDSLKIVRERPVPGAERNGPVVG